MYKSLFLLTYTLFIYVSYFDKKKKKKSFCYEPYYLLLFCKNFYFNVMPLFSLNFLFMHFACIKQISSLL